MLCEEELLFSFVRRWGWGKGGGGRYCVASTINKFQTHKLVKINLKQE